ncbi:PDR/VanB family oxidoreductase [Hydrogenophaga sp.]|uniref:PDR/VanB family oxidoreductase n=1 Tax=Hydrogenophaga sp. TaxID=1904254 RepID=UPI00271A3A20|nr:PDR/VanB family oxidoreductase [Hydrogenophaga sp.]MDO9504284.1 PDR/VanB family oxidoreductase [Hydrogenophaga sp.]
MQALYLLLRQIRLEAEGTASFELVDPDGRELPPFSAGAHVDVQIPGGPRRSYSLSSSPANRECYRITVRRDPASRGGSAWFHEQARVGMRLEAHGPRNEFELEESATHSVMLAGGIGITPLLTMIGRLNELGRGWSLHYSTRHMAEMAFTWELNRLQAQGDSELHRYATANGGARMDLRGIIASAPAGSHFYCCGPAAMIDGFLDATKALPPSHVHYERFSATQAAATDGGYQLRLMRDGRSLRVVPGRSMLDTLLDAGVDLPYSCTQGICGSCRVNVLHGQPDHRDECLSDEERASNRVVMPCCSGSLGPVLTLDL